VGVDDAVAPAVWSRFSRLRTRAPSSDASPSAILDWLEQMGRRSPGMVLYPTTDEYAWLMAYGSERLGHYYRMYSPGVATLSTLLDKSALHRMCVDLGIPTPTTWSPGSAREAEALVEQHGPLLMKPRSQMFYLGNGKGSVLHKPEHARRAFGHHERTSSYPKELLAHCPDLERPLLQAYVASGAHGTYSVSGFIDHHGNVLAQRAAMKTLQTPPQVGVGLEFESAEVDADALAAVVRLCRKVGYFGVFEVEFVRDGGVPKLVDFNPRYFGQMAFDIARHAALPWLVHLAACGHEDRARAEAILDAPLDAPRHYLNRVGLGFELLSSLGHPAATLSVFRSLWSGRSRRAVDATWQASDPGPALAAAAALIGWAVRHPLTIARGIARRRR